MATHRGDGGVKILAARDGQHRRRHLRFDRRLRRHPESDSPGDVAVADDTDRPAAGVDDNHA
ncbi:MAG: hypothetical protein IPK78_21105 [Rhodospirillales bacterium]|nr:hypothetical protein [Rhodospirillales bacterium]